MPATATASRLPEGLAPRILSQKEAAAYIGRSQGWFCRNQKKLRDDGFPAPIEALGGYDRAAIDDWLDRKSGRMNGLDSDAGNPWNDLL